MNNNILTLEQIQNMSTDELSLAYQNGYRLSDSTDIIHTDIRTNMYSLQTNSHYTSMDVAIITTSILISVGLIGLLTYHMIKREEKRIMSEIKETVVGTLVKQGPTLVERLAPFAERILERVAPAPTKPTQTV